MSDKLTLWQIDQEIEYIASQAITDDGEISLDVMSRLESLLVQSKDKIVNTGIFIARRKKEVEIAKQQVKEFNARIKREEKRLESLQYLSQKVLDVHHEGVAERGLITVKTAKNPESVVIDDEKALPCDFIETIKTTKINKNAIKDALKKGVEVPGARLVQGKSLRITGA